MTTGWSAWRRASAPARRILGGTPLFAAMVALLCACTSGGAATVTINVSEGEASTGAIDSRWIHGFDTNFFRSPEHVDDPQLWRFFADLRLPVLRFPGGLADWYDWRRGTIETQGREVLNFMKGGAFRPVGLGEVLGVAKEHKLSLLYVLSTYDPNDALAGLVGQLQAVGADVRGIEIGNEEETRLHADAHGGPQGYLDKARRMLHELRRLGYRGPVAVDLAPAWTPGQERHVDRERWNEWNAALQRDGLADFDAVVVHYYPLVKKIGFVEAARRGPEEFKRMVADVRARFAGKQVWITEWNLGQPADGAEFNSLGHAVFVMEMLAAFLEARVEVSVYHCLAGRGWELVGPDRTTLDYRAGQGAEMLRRAPYFAFRLFGEAYDGASEFRAGRDGPVGYILFRRAGKLSVVCWTKSSGQFVVRLTGAGHRVFVGGEAVQGALSCSNGSTARRGSGRGSELDKENCIPKSVDAPRITGPGIFKFDYDG